MEQANGASIAARRGGHGEYERVRSAWRELGSHAVYFFQTPEWIELLSERLEGDVAWGAVLADGRPAAVSILLRSVRRAGGVSLRILSQVRLGEAQHLYADSLIELRATALTRAGGCLGSVACVVAVGVARGITVA